MSVRTAAIVGVHWGLVHLRGLREADCEVVALAARDGPGAAAVAAREGVPRGTADVASLNAVDVVVIATPAATHCDLIRALPHPKLICEKPLLGMTGSLDDPPLTGGRMFVNYAFGFLSSARCMDAVVAERGAPDRIMLDVAVQLPSTFSAEQWFLEALSHPLSWLLLRNGPPTVTRRSVATDSVSVDLLSGEVPLQARLRIGGEPGIHQHVAMSWGDDVLRLRGRYRPGQPWTYDPVRWNGRAINEGEASATDCWLDANAASVRAIVRRFRGDPTPAPLFDATRALMVEAVLLGPVRG
jgi:dTDP-4-dehydrorhamnose reductase